MLISLHPLPPHKDLPACQLPHSFGEVGKEIGKEHLDTGSPVKAVAGAYRETAIIPPVRSRFTRKITVPAPRADRPKRRIVANLIPVPIPAMAR